MSLLTLENISISFGGPKILDDITLTIADRERVALLGRNGEGKSTLMKIILGTLEPTEGELIFHKKLRISCMQQDIPKDVKDKAFDVVMSAFAEFDDGSILSDKNHIWEVEHKASKFLSRMGIDETKPFNKLSGGMQRKVLLAKALVVDPDILLLDEPTNHMDIETIAWLEKILFEFRGSVVFVTHDRRFLKNVSNRIVEIDRGRAHDWGAVDYDKYLQKKEEWLEAEAKQHENFDKKLAEEETWLRKGLKARRTRNEGRVRALMDLRKERQKRRSVSQVAKIHTHEAEDSGRVIFKVHNLCHSFGELKIVEKFTAMIMRGDRIALLGPNGSGKSTLIKLLLDKLKPVSGTVKMGANLQIAYFDQHRSILNEEKSVAWNIAEGSNYVTINGRPQHVFGYLKKFCFEPDRSKTPVKALSGGERNRLLLAKVFTKPSNILILDEPTNDLDIETLEMLEDMLIRYEGTIILVSHDRSFINNVVTMNFAYEGNGEWCEYGGGYDDWLSQSADKRKKAEELKKKAELKAQKEKAKSEPKHEVQRKLKYSEQIELDKLPAQIEELEIKQTELNEILSDPTFYQESYDKARQVQEELAIVVDKLEQLYSRWEELEALANPE